MTIADIFREMKLGDVIGNLLLYPLKSLSPCDLIIAGPPCPPWAGNGNKLQEEDDRALVFIQVLVYLPGCGHTLLTNGAGPGNDSFHLRYITFSRMHNAMQPKTSHVRACFGREEGINTIES